MKCLILLLILLILILIYMIENNKELNILSLIFKKIKRYCSSWETYMIVICEKCGSHNKIDDPENINNYACGNCGHKPLGVVKPYNFPSTSTVITSAAVGAGIGGVMAGPAGVIMGGIAGAFIAGATGNQGGTEKNQ